VLRGDLDWIVMKCLEKDRARRYDTANGLAMDLQRHLKNEVVSARPPTTGYLLGKLIRRHRLAFAAGATVIASLVLVAFAAGAALMVSLVLGITAATWMYFRESAARKRATDAEKLALTDKANAEAALHFIQEDVLSQASPGYQPDRELTVRALLDRIADRLDRAGGRSPLVEASIRQTLGSVYTELGDYAKAVEHFEAALRIQREHLGESHVNTLRSLNGLAVARWWGGETSLAEPLTRQGLAASRRALSEKHPLTLQFMQTRAFVVMLLGETPWTEVEALFLQTLALHREVLGPDDPGTLRLIYGISVGYHFHGQPAKAEPLLVDALDRARRLDEKSPTTSGLMASLASTYWRLNQLEKAEPLALEAVELRRGTLGKEHNLTIASVCNLATIYVLQRQLDKAGPLTEQALNLSRRLPMKKSVFLVWNLSNLGWAYLDQGDIVRADSLCDLALQAMRRNPAFNPVASPRITANLGAVRFAQQNYADAETLLWEGLRLAEKHDSDAGYRFYLMNLLGASLAAQKNYADAEPLLLQSCEGLQQRQASLPPYLNAPRRITESLERLVQLYDAWDNPAQAAEWKQKLAEFQQLAQAVEKKIPPP
jgi:tetratricopeptide (TPR) repeat protein